jgi:hypothetical protein
MHAKKRYLPALGKLGKLAADGRYTIGLGERISKKRDAQRRSQWAASKSRVGSKCSLIIEGEN